MQLNLAMVEKKKKDHTSKRASYFIINFLFIVISTTVLIKLSR